jgi:hypothetical protein
VGLAALAVLALEGGARRNARQRAVDATAASAKRQMKAAKDSLDQNCPMEKKGGWSLLLLQPCRFSSERAKHSPINCPVTPFVAREQRRASRNRNNKMPKLSLYCLGRGIVKLESQKDRLCHPFPHIFGSLLAGVQAVFEVLETNKLLLLPTIVCRYTAAQKSLTRSDGYMSWSSMWGELRTCATCLWERSPPRHSLVDRLWP